MSQHNSQRSDIEEQTQIIFCYFSPKAKIGWQGRQLKVCDNCSQRCWFGLRSEERCLLVAISRLELFGQIDTHHQILNLRQMNLAYLEWAVGEDPLSLRHGLANCRAVWTGNM